MVLTLLLPSGFDVSGLATIMTQVHEECVKLGVAVVGGHTEGNLLPYHLCLHHLKLLLR